MRMKKLYCLIFIFIATSFIPFSALGDIKWIRQSEMQPKISDDADQSEVTFDFQTIWYFQGSPGSPASYGSEPDGWRRSWLRDAGSRFGCRNWWDPGAGEILPIRLGGNPYGTSVDTIQFAVPDSLGITIHQYYRYHPPAIVVDGLNIERPFPLLGDHYAPDKVWGTADVMVESHARNWLGLDIYQRVLSWVSRHHNQYIIYDWTIVNTGNTDLDDSIEREGYAIDSLYFMRQLAIMPNNESAQKAEWYQWSGVYPAWDEPRDSVRCVISYPALDFNYRPTYDYDGLGSFNFNEDFLTDVCSGGEVTLYVPRIDAEEKPVKPIGPGPNAASGDPENYPETDDSTQPKAHGIRGPDDLEFKQHSLMHPPTGPDSWETVYNCMIYGEKGDPSYDPYVEYMTGTYPETYHPEPPDHRGYDSFDDLTTVNPLIVWHLIADAIAGPFRLDYGDSIRIVWADCGGRLPTRTAWELGRAWKDSTITFVTQSGDTLDVNDISLTAPHLPNQADTIHIPPVYRNNPWRWQDAGYCNDAANLIKDMWVYSTVDSVIRHAINAQWNFDHNYDIPVPPPPPSIEVKSEADRIMISWNYEEPADVPSDLAGYRVYRSVGRAGPVCRNAGVLGEWNLIYEAGNNESYYYDTTAVRGEDYYYYVAAFDNAGHPEAEDPNGVTGTAEVLESGRWQNYTYGVLGAASLKRPGASDLSRVRVVPNPYNSASKNMQYGGDAEEKINFFNLPG
jgi:hypothetical protein